MTKLFSIISILACAGAVSLRGANPGDEVVIVYNSNVREYIGIDRHYAQARQVPANQIFGFALSTQEEISRQDFHDSLQNPLAKALESKHLWHVASQIVPETTNHPARVEWKVVESKIRYAVLCYGVPLRIAEDPTIKEEGLDKLRPEMRRNEAAVDSELALLPILEQK